MRDGNRFVGLVDCFSQKLPFRQKGGIFSDNRPFLIFKIWMIAVTARTNELAKGKKITFNRIDFYGY